jgi:2-(1,2-epoxy-1,2-dihydrophenyl)acetyl-CoA isomerase
MASKVGVSTAASRHLMSHTVIEVETRDGIGLLRLNDPATLNALSLVMTEEIDRAIDQLVGAARVIILTGAGRAFCSGANLTGGIDWTGVPGEQPDFGRVLETHVNPMMNKLRDLPVPWISAVRGAAVGVGCSLALAADLVLVSDTAYFLQAFSRIGLVPDGGSSHLLTRAVGRVRATEMMLLGERIPARQALEWGLVNRVFADDQLDGQALELAAQIAAGPTRALGLIRKLAWAAVDVDWTSALQTERNLQKIAGRTADAKEGIRAFMEKRPAKFTGQ